MVPHWEEILVDKRYLVSKRYFIIKRFLIDRRYLFVKRYSLGECTSLIKGASSREGTLLT